MCVCVCVVKISIMGSDVIFPNCTGIFTHFIISRELDKHLRYSQKETPGYLVGNLVATNWPIEKALHAIGYNQIPTK